MTIHLLSYNNYYNRIIKKEESLEGYAEYILGSFSGVNFNPNDGVEASQVVNYRGQTPDYFIVSDNGEIVSRWFVIEAQYDRLGQYVLTLHRDVIADQYEQVIEAPIYLEKATVQSGNPLIFNHEGMTFNQIKTSEDVLQDETGKAWIVGYLDLGSVDAAEVNKEHRVATNQPVGLYTNYDEWYERTLSDNYIATGRKQFVVSFRNEDNHRRDCLATLYIDFDKGSFEYSYKYRTYNYPASSLAFFDYVPYTDFDQALPELCRGILEIPGVLTTLKDGLGLADDYSVDNGRIVEDTDTTTYYTIGVDVQPSEHQIQKNLSTMPGLDLAIKNIIEGIAGLSSNGRTTGDAPYVAQKEGVSTQVVTLTETDWGDCAVTFDAGRRVLTDAPYYMFCMPFDRSNLATYMLAIKIAEDCSSHMYDVQLLPYCPIDIEDPNLTEHLDYETITLSGGGTDKLYWCGKSVFTKDINYSIVIDDYKISNECDTWRLCSPNGNGTFEFNAAKNYGVSKFNVDCAYRPIDPYIHINPDFGGLYGSDFDDFRGLICNGDFSLPRINDAWQTYITYNKNYENIFNREIKSLNLQNKWAHRQDILNAITGTLSGGLAGFGGGYQLAGGLGGGIGAGIGTVASAAGGAVSVYANQQLRDDAKDLKKDLYQFNNGNIQAQPDSISKTGCLTNNNKLFPYIEYYTCTEQEKQALREKIKYNGMTLNVIGKISDYQLETPSYIKGQLVRLDSISEDFHYVNSIADELSKGVFI